MNKENEAELYTDHDQFYTAQGGYKMTLRVYPHLRKRTHVSAYIHEDHNLSFPFSGIFTIKLLNCKQECII